MLRAVNGISYNPPYIYGTNSTYSGSAETVVNHVFVPANTFKQYDLFGVQTRLTKTTTTATFSVRIRIGTAVNTSGTLAGIYTSTTTTHTVAPIERRFSIQSLTNDTRVIPVSLSRAQDYSDASGTTAISSLSIDWTQNQYIVITSQTTSAAQVINCPYVYLDIIEPLV
jgi:hypothetical protein